MEKKELRLWMMAKAVIIGLLLGVAGKMYAYDFYAVCETGQTLYYTIIDAENHYVELTSPCGGYDGWFGPDKPTGNIILSESVQYNGVNYIVTTIGYYAFFGCSGLTGSLNIPLSVTKIDFGAFYECSGITSIFIPDSVTSIGGSAFFGTGWYNNQADGILYLGDCCLGYKGEEPIGILCIQDGTRLVAEYAFIECYSLSSVIIPNTVTHVGSFAFFCTSISEVTLSNSLTSIEDNVFHGCNFLTSVDIPNSVTSIGMEAFSECMNLANVTIPNSVTSIDSRAFSDTNIHSLTLPNSLQTIGGGAFSCCFNLKGSLIIPNSVTSIYTQAFHFCDSITSITIGNSVSYIGFGAFNCRGLALITVLNETPPSLSSSYYDYSGVFESVNKSIPVYVPYGTMAAYMSAPGWNEFTNYQEMLPVNTTQTVEFAAGWNWFSTNVEITLDDLKAALVEAVPNTNITIKSNAQNIAYNSGTNQWRGTLDSLDVSQMYMIQVGANCQITLTGTSINPNACPITIHNGNNWIAFPLSESMSVSDAFSGFATNGDIIKSRTTTARYNNGNWRGGLDSLEPGQGYIYKSNVTETRTFTFPINTK